MAETLVINGMTYREVDGLNMLNENGETVLYYADAVRYAAQELTEDQKAQARQNIGLPEAINDALAQAKETGKFDGADGFSIYLYNAVITESPDGTLELSRYGILNPDDRPIVVGDLVLSTSENNLYRIIGFVDYATLSVQLVGSIQGKPGKDGTSVTVKSVSESTADGGSNVVTFSDGKTVTIKNGSKGDPYTLTSADKTAIVSAVIAALPVYSGEVL